MHVQSCCFANLNLFLFCRSGCRRCRRCLSSLLGTLRSDDGDGNWNFKKIIVKISKTTTLHVHHAFLYISLPSLHDYDEKMPNFTFYGGRKQATMKFSFSFWTRIWFFRNLTPEEFAYIWQSKWVGTVAMKIEWTRIHFLSGVFAAIAVLGS